jgi:hypothetical protein
LHVGFGLDAAAAAQVRETIDDAISLTPGRLGSNVFRKALRSGAVATLRAPVELIDIASGGALRRLLRGGGDEVEAVAEVDAAIERSMAADRSFIARATSAAERQLSAHDNPYVDDLITTFESLWRARTAGATGATDNRDDGDRDDRDRDRDNRGDRGNGDPGDGDRDSDRDDHDDDARPTPHE